MARRFRLSASVVGPTLLVFGLLVAGSGLIPTNAFVIASFVAAPIAVWGRWDAPGAIWLALGFPVAAELIGLALASTAPLIPATFDPQLALLDAELFPWVAHLAEWTRHRAVLYITVQAVYVGLPVAAAVLVRLRGASLVSPLLGTGAIGWVLYWIVPATGPAYGGNLPAPRNAVPSLHVTWVLLLAAAAWRYRTARPIIVAFVTFTALATISIGEHYGIDLIFAIPFAAAVWQAYRGKWASSTICGIILLSSLFALRYALG